MLRACARRWRSFHRGGSVALYIALYSVGFLVNTLHSLSGFVSVFLYLSYMTLVLWGIYLAMGTVGFFASLLFTYNIFSAVKAD
jgi:transmembrane 9 superfamily protein 2/4